MIDSAGHCSICHQDYAPNAYHSCGGTPTPCGPRCSGRVMFRSAPVPFNRDDMVVSSIDAEVLASLRRIEVLLQRLLET